MSIRLLFSSTSACNFSIGLSLDRPLKLVDPPPERLDLVEGAVYLQGVGVGSLVGVDEILLDELGTRRGRHSLARLAATSNIVITMVFYHTFRDAASP